MIKLDGIKHRLDANETLYMARELESVEAKLYEWKERELKYRTYVPVSNKDNPGANTITYRMLTMIGMAKIIANYADDLPRADAYMKEYSQSVKSLATSIGYNTQELRAAAMANVPLETVKANAARRAIRQLESAICWDGDDEKGITGLLNNTNIPTLAAADGADPVASAWSGKTAAEIITDINAPISQVRSQSNGVHAADTMLLPIPQYDIIATTPRSSTSDLTILEYITKPGNKFGLKTVDWLSTELELAFTSGTEDGAIVYERSAEVLEHRIPLEMQHLPVQERGLEFIIPIESRDGGVVVRYPLAMVFFTGI